MKPYGHELPTMLGYKPSGVDWIGDIPAHWEVRRLGNLSTLWASSVDKLSSEDETPVRLCNYVDVYKNRAITDGLPYMHATATTDEIRRNRLLVGDVAFTKDSESFDDIAIPAYVADAADDLVYGYHLMIARPGALLGGRFATWFFSINKHRWQFEIKARGVTRFGLPQSAFREAMLPLPPLEEQQAIADELDAVDAQTKDSITTLQSAIALAEEYRQAVISETVTGRRRLMPR